MVEDLEVTRYQIESNKLVNNPTEVKIIGDTTTICQVVQLLAYIRNVIKNNSSKDITVRIGKNIQNSTFLFDVNSQEIPDLIAKDFIDIN